MEKERCMKAVFTTDIVISITAVAALFCTSTVAIIAYVLVNMVTIVLSSELVTSDSRYRNAWWFYAGGCAMITLALALLWQDYRLDNRIKLTIAVPFVLSAIFYILAEKKEKKKILAEKKEKKEQE